MFAWLSRRVMPNTYTNVQGLCASTEMQAEKNFIVITVGVVRNSWYAKALDDPFREIEHKTSKNARSDHRTDVDSGHRFILIVDISSI